MKNILMIMALISISACTYADADEWPDKECNEYSAYIGFLAGASGAAMEEAGKANEAGDKALATTMAGSSDQFTISIFSPCNSLTTAWTLLPLIPTQAPTGSKEVSIALTQIFALLPGSLDEDLISIKPS